MIDSGYIKGGLEFAMSGGLIVDVAKNNAITNNGVTLTTDHNGRANKGLSFVAADNDYLTTATIEALLGNAGTMQIGFKWSGVTTPAIQTLFNNRNAGGAYTSCIWTANILRVGTNAGGSVLDKSIAFTDTNMHMLTMIWAGDSLLAYLDLSSMAGTDSGAATVGTAFVIGQRSNFGLRAFDGMIDTVLGYSRALQANEWVKNYNYWLSH